MKKIVSAFLVVGLMLTSGCLLAPCSTYNHNRVKENIVGQQIMAKGNPAQIKAMNAGIKPSSVIKIIPSNDGRGAFVAMDWLNPDNSTYFKTYAEAPISSTVALLGDGTLWTGLIYLGSKVLDNQSGKQETNISVGDGSGSTVINNKSGGNSTTIKTGGNGGGNTVINNDGSNGNTTIIDNTPPTP